MALPTAVDLVAVHGLAGKGKSRVSTYLSEIKPVPFSVNNPGYSEKLLSRIEQLNSPETALQNGSPVHVHGVGGERKTLSSTYEGTYTFPHYQAMFSPSILNNENRDSGNDQDSIFDSAGSLTSEGTLTSVDTAADSSENDSDQWDCGNCDNCGWNCFNCIDETISRLKLERYHRWQNIELWEKALQTISEPTPCP